MCSPLALPPRNSPFITHSPIHPLTPPLPPHSHTPTTQIPARVPPQALKDKYTKATQGIKEAVRRFLAETREATVQTLQEAVGWLLWLVVRVMGNGECEVTVEGCCGEYWKV